MHTTLEQPGGQLIAPVQAMGWLVLLLPTHGLQRSSCDAEAWNERIQALMGLWDACSPSQWWSGQCLGLLARMAKHDTQGAARAACRQPLLGRLPLAWLRSSCMTDTASGTSSDPRILQSL